MTGRESVNVALACCLVHWCVNVVNGRTWVIACRRHVHFCNFLSVALLRSHHSRLEDKITYALAGYGLSLTSVHQSETQLMLGKWARAAKTEHNRKFHSYKQEQISKSASTPGRMPQAAYPLEPFWPHRITEGDWEKNTDLVTSFQIGSYDPDQKAFAVLYSAHFDRIDNPEHYIFIPRKYKNGLRLLNAKISYLQQCARLLLAPVPRNTPSAGRQNVRAARDLAISNLIFSVAVRSAFLGEVNLALYHGTAFKRRKKFIANIDFNSPIMDNWLCCEFHHGRHDPRSLTEELESIPYKMKSLWDYGAFFFPNCDKLYVAYSRPQNGTTIGTAGKRCPKKFPIGECHHQRRRLQQRPPREFRPSRLKNTFH